MPTIPLSQIIINRGDRIRKNITEEQIESKAESMSRVGQINPITINRDTILGLHELVAGETRYLAAHKLGWEEIEVRFYEDLDELAKLSIELEENIKRTDLTWQDQCDALRRFHEINKKNDPAWKQQDTSSALGLAQQTVSMQLAVAEELVKGNTRIANLPNYSTAREIVKRQNERKAQDQATALLGIKEPERLVKKTPIIQANFHEWAPQYTGQPFNFLHIDFPYGINSHANSNNKQFAAKSFGGYSDTREDHLRLCATLYNNRYKLMGESCHMLFWFSMHYYQETLDWLKQWLWVDPFPLIWAKTAGIIPNPAMNPRRCYETAFFCSFPKEAPRKIISSVANWHSSKVIREADHMSEKSTETLSHFFRMFVDGNTRMLDPTCGSASALRAARDSGAGSVLGLEANEEYVRLAVEAWDRAEL